MQGNRIVSIGFQYLPPNVSVWQEKIEIFAGGRFWL
jgi:hypothetical protein